MANQWYVVHIHSGFEEKVEHAVREKAASKNLDKRIAQIFVPREKVDNIHRGQRVTRERNYLPGYILIHMDMNDELQHMIKNTPKVTGFLGNDHHPSPISDKEAEEIIRQISESSEHPRQSILFQIGEQVRVCEGPFASCNGYVEEIDAERSRLKVSVSLFGRATPVELEYGQVEKF